MTPVRSAGSHTRFTRRAFVVAAVSGAVIAFAPVPLWWEAPAATGNEPRDAVVTFYMDRLYLDRTGTAQPYRAPRGARSAAPVAHLNEEEFRRCYVYV